MDQQVLELDTCDSVQCELCDEWICECRMATKCGTHFDEGCIHGEPS